MIAKPPLSAEASRHGKCARIVWLLILLCSLSIAQNQADTLEYALKASWLTKFVKYVEWPTGQNKASLVIGILGDDPFDQLFSPVEGKQFLGRRLTIVRFGQYKEGLDLAQCDLLFVSHSEQENTQEILSQVANRPVLTVSDFAGFAEAGGVINFLPMKRERIRYEVNQGQAEMMGFRVTAPLLRYADRVISADGRRK